MAASPQVQELVASPQLAGLQRIDLLKALEDLTAKAFEQDLGATGSAAAVPGGADTLLRAALQQQFVGLAEYSPAWHAALDAAERRQALQREAVLAALSSLPHGFDQLDRCLICNAALVSGKYAAFYRAWIAVGNALAAELAEADKEGRLPRELYNHYTIITKARHLFTGDGYGHVAYAEAFPQEVGAILVELDNWITVLTDVDTDHQQVKQQYLAYLRQMRACLAETDISQLEGKWRQLDVLWMDIRHPVQVQPEFSLRILDEAYAKENKTIRQIQSVMEAYFEQRQGRLAREGLGALQRSMAGIYYLPFLTGASLHFRFAGQSIPNRSDVRAECGVKIFFDVVSAETRAAAARELAVQVCALPLARPFCSWPGWRSEPSRWSFVLEDPSRAQAIHPLDSIVFLVAPHEVGHAIYSLDNLKEVIRPATKTLLEEPRAELTALHALVISANSSHCLQESAERLLSCFLLSDLRRFAAWDSSTTRPYTVSAMSCWARAERTGLVSLTADAQQKVVMHDSKVAAFLAESSRLFEQILAAEDAMDGSAVEAILQEASGLCLCNPGRQSQLVFIAAAGKLMAEDRKLATW
ncbi:hypothetical protein ABPG77_010222 [Micractinium sp. CCAP 211/92]